MDEGEGEEYTSSRSDQKDAELSVFWSYIVMMLNNLDCLPVEEIHQKLRIFAMQVLLFLYYLWTRGGLMNKC